MYSRIFTLSKQTKWGLTNFDEQKVFKLVVFFSLRIINKTISCAAWFSTLDINCNLFGKGILVSFIELRRDQSVIILITSKQLFPRDLNSLNTIQKRFCILRVLFSV
jgi:hypothetical protein